MRKMMMSGRILKQPSHDFKATNFASKMDELFLKQIDFQKEVTNLINLPDDSPQWYSYHMLAMIEELGEILKVDKRWKTHRNKAHIQSEKELEIADLFITVMNICIFSNVDYERLLEIVSNKIQENFKRLEESKINIR